MSKIILILLFVVASSSVHADSSVWKVSKGDDHIYIAGTVHVLSESDYPLPVEFDRAFVAAKKIIFETDIGGMQSPEYQLAIVKALMYPRGQNLQQKISRRTYTRLKKHLDARGLSIDMLMNYKPGMILSSLVMGELKRLGVSGVGVDKHYYARAVKNRKKIGQLESLEQQIGFLSELGVGEEDEFINYTLDELESLPQIFNRIRKVWREGDMSIFDKEMVVPLKKEYPDIYKLMLLDRNNAWLPKIEVMFGTAGVELVLVGTLHLAGDDGLLKKLKARGYRVQQL